MKQSVFDWLIVFLCVVCSSCGGPACANDRCPVGDLNQDCQVDFSDLMRLADQWLDGWRGPQHGLEAHWKLDEGAGLFAADSTPNDYTGELRNGPLWKPTGGMLGGALQFDGVDDFVTAPFVLNPAEGPLSVFAWVNGGDDREVIITQTNDAGGGVGREWLQIDTADGTLVTRLTDGMSKLGCDVVITDGLWHHVGVVWDGSLRYLYVDGYEVARDSSPLSHLQACDGSMYIGIGKTLMANTCWSGLIDDVRIYARAVGPDEIAAIAQPPETPGPDDANLNGRDGVDFADFAILAYNWMTGPPGEYRSIWVDSWYWNRSFVSEDEADQLLRYCRQYNINTVIVEVRKIGDACYYSNIEPRIEKWMTPPSFDPLGYLINEAHDTSGGKKYIEVHAWFCAQRIYREGSKIPTLAEMPDHVLSKHPDYVMEDINGNEITSDSRFLDPGHPGAVDWNVDVIVDCLRNYDIDGINLDYIRYPGAAWGYNPVSVARFNAFRNRSGKPAASDALWSDWRRECLTQQVKKIYVKSLMVDPDVVVTTDTVAWAGGGEWRDFKTSRPYTDVFQDWVGWLRAGIIDYNALMGYYQKADPRYQGYHEGWCKLSLDNDDKRGSILCTAAYKQIMVQHSMDQLLDIRSWGAAGLNIYDWYSEVNASQSGESRVDFYRELKAQVYPEWVDPPVHKWKVRPTTGIFEGKLTDAGSPVDHGTVEIEGYPSTRVYTDGSGWYAIMEVVRGEHVLRFSTPGYPDILVGADMPRAGEIVSVNADL